MVVNSKKLYKMDVYRKVSVLKEFDRNPNLRAEDIDNILKWIKTVSHIPRITESEAILFLHSCCYDLDQTKVKILKYFEYCTQYKEFFSNLDLMNEDVACMGNALTIAALPQKTPEGYKVILGRLRSMNPAEVDFARGAKLFNMVCDVVHLTEGSQKKFVFLIDTTGASFGHLIRLNPITLKHFLDYFQEALPMCVDKIHIFNVVPVVYRIYALFRPFISQDMLDMLVFHDTLETLHQCIQSDIFPSDYPGGKAATLEEFHYSYYKELINHQEFFILQEKTRRIKENFNKSDGWFGSLMFN